MCRCRLIVRSKVGSADIHPVHLHRHSFELIRVAEKKTAGIMKDVVMVYGAVRLRLAAWGAQSRPALSSVYEKFHRARSIERGWFCNRCSAEGSLQPGPPRSCRAAPSGVSLAVALRRARLVSLNGHFWRKVAVATAD